MNNFFWPLFLTGCQLTWVFDQDLDYDNDGYITDQAQGGDDCKDHLAAINPGAVEKEGDGIDQNCNGDNDEDADLDGYTIDQGDCDDNANWIRNDYFEMAQDTDDNDCDKVVNEINDLGGRNWLSWAGEAAGDQFGWAVAGGDTDGDGYSDLVVTAPKALAHQRFEGITYKISGRQEWAPSLLDYDADATVTGTAEYDRAGSSVALGDLDGDGVAEPVLGALGYDVGDGNSNGAVGLFDPLATGATDFSNAGILWEGSDDFGNAGQSVAFIGNVTGDLGEEILVGADGINRAYVLASSEKAGQGGSLGDVATALLEGSEEDEHFGWSVAGGNDLDGDGISDYAVGAPSHSSNLLSAGAVYVYSGGTFPPSEPLILRGLVEYGGVGFSLALVNDVESDGYGDLLTGAPAQGARGDASRGVVYLLPGSADLSQSTLEEATQIQGQYENEFLGLSVANAGDINSDGFGDFLLGSLSDEGGEDAGAIYLFLGGVRSYDLAEYGANNADAIFLGTGGMMAYVGNRVGNVNGKHYDDIEASLPYDDFVIGAPGDNDQAGRAFLFLGQPTHP